MRQGKRERGDVACADCGVTTPKRCHKTIRCPACQFKSILKRDQKRQSGNRKVAVERWQANGHRCWWCGEALAWTAIEFDHIIPVSKGGGDKENLVPSCRGCNLKKSDGPAPADAKGAITGGQMDGVHFETLGKLMVGLEQLVGRPVELSDIFETVRA
ncbi:HNH endonuclease [Deinococcus sp. QL22]|uniref:HNH endonuclease n=1 Tax=Deinococcus sp. QL22 TaxID=2939437 RepID=UPI0020178F96|nr:HNH endonuclease signature motif containing protein [Deinococcus sp. QL22]UQN10337.1 HNH endonuclease [Deinococcus sp. QL22]UQN10471.1 HNH endonuclease [Deinococcus sp. QL22]